MDRRVVLAIVLMMAVAILPSMFFRPQRQAARRTAAHPDSVRLQPPPPAPGPRLVPDTVPTVGPSEPPSAREDTVLVTSPLYRYAFSTRGGRMIEATLSRYRSMHPQERDLPVQLLRSESDLLVLGLLVGRDTLSFREWEFVPSSTILDVTGEPRALTLTTSRGALTLALRYTFRPDDYLVDVVGQVEGLGPEGAQLLVGMGPGLRNTEADSLEHHRELGAVVKADKARLTRLQSLDLGVPEAFNGPFEWVAIKSKYFVAALLALDQSGGGRNGGISGAVATATDRVNRKPAAAEVWASIPLAAAGTFGYSAYVGPMEYPRLRAIGHDFDDVNPYGWPGFRTIIRPVAVGARWLLVWMHEAVGLAYGLGLVVFGVLIRILLWPLNQRAMRSSMQMQAVQPLMKELQTKYKNEPQKLQQEMFKLYKEHNVNPFGGCWPLLLPWPILLALFFVFQNTIELRGAAFLWLPDLARPDPYYIIPVIMGLSMYALTKIGQLGMEPNPQMKMMLYVMPAMMTFLFLNFASGLNLYYTVMNLASLPQQWMVAQERMRRAGKPPQPKATPPKPIPPKPAPAKR